MKKHIYTALILLLGISGLQESAYAREKSTQQHSEAAKRKKEKIESAGTNQPKFIDYLFTLLKRTGQLKFDRDTIKQSIAVSIEALPEGNKKDEFIAEFNTTFDDNYDEYLKTLPHGLTIQGICKAESEKLNAHRQELADAIKNFAQAIESILTAPVKKSDNCSKYKEELLAIRRYDKAKHDLIATGKSLGFSFNISMPFFEDFLLNIDLWLEQKPWTTYDECINNLLEKLKEQKNIFNAFKDITQNKMPESQYNAPEQEDILTSLCKSDLGKEKELQAAMENLVKNLDRIIHSMLYLNFLKFKGIELSEFKNIFNDLISNTDTPEKVAGEIAKSFDAYKKDQEKLTQIGKSIGLNIEFATNRFNDQIPKILLPDNIKKYTKEDLGRWCPA